jgi:hypothetical protein
MGRLQAGWPKALGALGLRFPPLLVGERQGEAPLLRGADLCRIGGRPTTVSAGAPATGQWRVHASEVRRPNRRRLFSRLADSVGVGQLPHGQQRPPCRLAPQPTRGIQPGIDSHCPHRPCHFRRRMFLQVATTPDELYGRAATGHRQGVAEDDDGRVDPALPVGVIDFDEDITPTEGLLAGPKLRRSCRCSTERRTGGSPCPASSSVEHRGLGGARLIELGIGQV